MGCGIENFYCSKKKNDYETLLIECINEIFIIFAITMLFHFGPLLLWDVSTNWFNHNHLQMSLLHVAHMMN